MAVKGVTREDRAAARALATRARRAAHYRGRMAQAITAGRLPLALSEACQYLRAVAGDLPDDAVKALVQDVVDLADERNQQ